MVVQLPLSCCYRGLKTQFVRQMLFAKTACSRSAIRVCDVPNGHLKKILKVAAVVG